MDKCTSFHCVYVCIFSGCSAGVNPVFFPHFIQSDGEGMTAKIGQKFLHKISAIDSMVVDKKYIYIYI